MEDEEEKERKIKVLYVDDEEGAIYVTNIFLKRMGYDNIEITPVSYTHLTLPTTERV